MTKLSNGFEYNNPHLKIEFAEYLLQNGFNVSLRAGAIAFHKSFLSVYFRGVNVDFFNDKAETLEAYQSGFVGIDSLDLNGFILLMHLMGIQDLRQFKTNAAAISKQHGVEASTITKFLFASLHNIPHKDKKNLKIHG